MLSPVFSFFKFLLNKLLWLAAIAVFLYFILGVFTFSSNSHKFVTLFENINGLERGAPVLLGGVQVGKVTQIRPIANSRMLAVTSSISKSDLNIDPDTVNTRMVENYEEGGGKALEIIFYKNNTGLKMTNGDAPYYVKYASRIALDGMQLSKDFALNMLGAITKQKDLSERAQLENQIDSSLASIENGLLDVDLDKSRRGLNRQIRDIERYKEEHPEEKDKSFTNNLKAIKNTFKSLTPVSEVYKY